VQLVRERLVGSVGASPHQEKSPDELQPSDRERAIPDLHPEKAGQSEVDIAEKPGRHPSTIIRELRRNNGLRGCRPGQA